MNSFEYLDTRSILIVALTMAVLMGLVSLGLASVERGTRALRLCGWSLLLFALGMGLVALRGQVPDLVGVLIGDTVLFAAAIPMMGSVRSINGEAAGDVPGWLLVAMGFVLITFWLLVSPDQTARIVVFSAIIALQYFRIARYLFSSLPKQGRSSQAFTAAVAALFSVSSAARVVLTLTAGKLDDLFQPSHVQSVSLLAYIVFLVGATLGIMWMEIQRLEANLVRLATIDGLTGMLNRRAFLDAAEREISRCKRSGESFGFAMFDLDWFKRINDTYGHPAGDSVLRWSADTLRNAIRPHDFLGRYGGEEFALVLPGTDTITASAVVERCRQAVERQSIDHDGRPIRVTVSAGIAAFGEDGSDLATLTAAADAALYQAKKAGRNRVVAASDADSQRVPPHPSSLLARQ